MYVSENEPYEGNALAIHEIKANEQLLSINR